jgi:hypothetical protein
MKTGILCIGMCLALLLPLLTFFAPVSSAQSAIDDATFCAPGSTRPCPDVGICTGRVKTCDNGKWSQECSGGTAPASQEICDNGLDDNCNGVMDECVSLSGSIGIFLIIGGVVLLGFAILLSRFIK